MEIDDGPLVAPIALDQGANAPAAALDEVVPPGGGPLVAPIALDQGANAPAAALDEVAPPGGGPPVAPIPAGSRG